MPFVPEWAPNVHPLIIHFPIALLFTAALFDTIGMILKKLPFWKNAATVLYILGALAALLALLTGEAAGDSVFLPTAANVLLTEHSDLAHYVVYFFGAFAVIRIAFFLLKLEDKMMFRSILYIIGLGGLVLLWSTADHGARMVFEYGVGVQAVDNTGVHVPAVSDSTQSSAPAHNSEGGLTWKPTRASAWHDAVTFFGDESGFMSSMRDGAERGDVLALSAQGNPIMFTFDRPMTTMQLDGALNLDDFEGTVMFVHHVIDNNNYHFTSISKVAMKQGRSENGDLYLMDDKPYAPTGWSSYRVVADQTHFRAYADQKLIVHGHGDDPGSGKVGLRLNGKGTVLLDFVQTVSLRGEGMGETAMEMDH
jgi:uncharacterized membrane protein